MVSLGTKTIWVGLGAKIVRRLKHKEKYLDKFRTKIYLDSLGTIVLVGWFKTQKYFQVRFRHKKIGLVTKTTWVCLDTKIARVGLGTKTTWAGMDKKYLGMFRDKKLLG